jgi:hypothetical protein
MPTFVGLANWQRRYLLEIGDAKLLMLAQNSRLPGITETRQDDWLHHTADGLSENFAATRQRMVVGELRELSRRIG